MIPHLHGAWPMPKAPKAVAVAAERPPQLGPAMARLDARKQAFVMALFVSGGNKARAAAAAGWSRMTGSRLGQDPEVQAASGEFAREHPAVPGPRRVAGL